MAGLRVYQSFRVLLLPGFGVGSSIPHAPGQPSSVDDSCVNILCVMYVIFFCYM